METYKAVYYLTANDLEMPDGTFAKHTIILEYEDISLMESDSIYRMLSKGADENCIVEMELLQKYEANEAELKEVV